MKKLFVFIGESGSGKTTLISELVRRYPDQFRKVVTCTSRPIRDGEVDGFDYHFLPKEYFLDNSNLVLTKKMDDGVYYGTRNSDLLSLDRHLLLTSKATGITRLLEFGCRNIAVVRMSISHQLKIERMRQRGDTEKMISDRLQIDDIDDGAGVGFEKTLVINLQATCTIEDNVKFVIEAC